MVQCSFQKLWGFPYHLPTRHLSTQLLKGGMTRLTHSVSTARVMYSINAEADGLTSAPQELGDTYYSSIFEKCESHHNLCMK